MDEAPRLPDYLFGRNPDIEREADLFLAGTLVTDLPKDSKMRKRDQRWVRRVIDELVRLALGESGHDRSRHMAQRRQTSQWSWPAIRHASCSQALQAVHLCRCARR